MPILRMLLWLLAGLLVLDGIMTRLAYGSSGHLALAGVGLAAVLVLTSDRTRRYLK